MLIEDHAILREGLRALLELEPHLVVVGEAASVAQAKSVAASVRPDVVLTDIAFPGESGLSIIPWLKNTAPTTRVLILTAHCTDEYVRAALEVGADGYILKDASRAELLEGLRTVLAGRQYLSAAVTSHVISGYLHKREVTPLQQGPITSRERGVALNRPRLPDESHRNATPAEHQDRRKAPFEPDAQAQLAQYGRCHALCRAP